MKKYIYLFMAIVIMQGCGGGEKSSQDEGGDTAQETYSYPKTAKVDVVDDYHGTNVEDPYRWLEAADSQAVRDWIGEQNDVTFSYLEKIEYREDIRKRLEEIWNYPKYSAPFKSQGNYFFYKNDGLQNQSVLYIQDGLDGTPSVFLDPNSFSKDGTSSLSMFSVSKNGKYAAYGISEGGSDWNEYFVKNVETGEKMSDHLEWIKFSGAAWQGDGFYYGRFAAPKAGQELSSQNENKQLYYHKLGDPQSKDRLVFEDREHPLRSIYASTSDDESLLFIYQTQGASNANSLYIKDLSRPNAEIQRLITGFDHSYSPIDNSGRKLLVMTNDDAPRYRLIEIDLDNPDRRNWKTVIPEQEEVLRSVSSVGGKLFASYLKDASSKIYVHSLDGERVGEVELPGIGTVGGFGGKKEDKIAFYTFTSYTYPSTIFRYDVESGKSEIFRKSEIDFKSDDYETKQVFFSSKDGTKVPMFIVHKKGLKLDGSNPTFLYGYGGFNVNILPAFRTTVTTLLENGGIYAVATLRGGGEYGEDWHKAGMLMNKQNVFNDFIAAAEYLINEKYTSKEKLAIHGRSNGGLLVGAVMTQRPDLCKVAFPGVGVMDMLRYHKFTIGHAWAVEYGSSDDPEHFKNLYGYSPLHNLKPGTDYPATLVTTADHDDRVVPAHSFKFISRLQECHTGNNPVMIRVDTKAGHGAGKPTAMIIEEWADIWSFMFHNMGVKPNYGIPAS